MTDIPKIRKAPSYIDPHLLHRKALEKKHFSNETTKGPMASLLTIELNISELCNRTCVFCPRVDPKIYPNRNLNMEPELISRLIDEVERMELLCRFSFSGFGEPLLHKGFPEMIRQIRDRLPDNIIEVNTSGDQLDSSIIKHLFGAGLTYLYINLYDGPEQLNKFKKMIKDSGIGDDLVILRDRWYSDKKDYGVKARQYRNSKNGLLLLYPIEKPNHKESKSKICFGFAISFPSKSKTKPNENSISYTVNNVYFNQEFVSDNT